MVVKEPEQRPHVEDPASGVLDPKALDAKADMPKTRTGGRPSLSRPLDEYVDQMTLLDMLGLDLVGFKGPKPDRDRAIKRARRATWRYLGLPVPAADQDPANDEATARLFAVDRPCR